MCLPRRPGHISGVHARGQALRRPGGQALTVTLLLALGVLLWLASQRERMHTPARQRGKLTPTCAKPLQTWEGEGGAATPPAR